MPPRQRRQARRPTSADVDALFTNLVTPHVTRQMILNRQHRASGGQRPYGPPSGVDAGGAVPHHHGTGHHHRQRR